jgi:hypothetical protein
MFAIALANERRMEGVSCQLSVEPPWDDHVKVLVGEAELTDAVECEWTVFDPVKIEPTSDNGCIAELDTHVDKESYVYRRLLE